MKYNFEPDFEINAVLTDIANELAEKNRIARLALKREFNKQAYRRLYRRFKDEHGIEHVVQPEDKQKDEYIEDCKIIDEELCDHAVDDYHEMSKNAKDDRKDNND